MDDAPPAGAYQEPLADASDEAIVSNATKGIIGGRKFPSGRQERIYFNNDAQMISRQISTPDRDPPLGSHSTLLAIGYKYGSLGIIAFFGLWIFTGLAPLRTIRGRTGPMLDDARALWVGVTAFGAQFLIYESDFDSVSPVAFYLLSGLLLGLAGRAAPVELPSREPSEPARTRNA